ncbi:MAG: hypothetical protein Edafosvirus21_18 [Edafosvirus sp.]|uniref:Uncharacterized protein n=1 Tax=Edafosvirus sp. TaxID=2487765 RepID=A0A3G4ZZ12_9VIRU|nr:MAG: hypothetical protein Edafosvirus21_18 [Edafosvirus sp.]
MARLVEAIREGDMELANCIIDNGCNINATMNDDMSFLMYAIYYKRNKLAHKLINMNECDIHIKNKYGVTALMYAITTRNLEIINILIKKKCDINVQIRSSRDTGLMIAFDDNCFKIVDVLIDNKCDLYLENSNGHTIFDILINHHKKLLFLINKLIKNGDITFLEKSKCKDKLLKFIHDNKMIESIWNMYESKMKDIISDGDNILAYSFVNNLGDFNVIKLLIRYTY